MNIIGKIIACLILFCTATYGAVRGGLPEFANVRYERRVLVITTNESQAQFVGKIGNKGVAGILAASNDIEVPLGETSLFYIRHHSLTLTPLAEAKGFSVQRITDLRSARRGLKKEEFSINITPDGKVTFGDVTVKEEPAAEVNKDKTPREAPAEGEGGSKLQPPPPIQEHPSGMGKTAPPEQGNPSMREGAPEDKKPWFLFAIVGLGVGVLLVWVFRKIQVR